MIEDIVLNYIIIFILLEIFEVGWQKAQTLIGMLARMFHYYNKNILLFLLMHPTFYFSILFMILCNYNIYALSIVGIKMLDIGMKIVLLQQVFIERKVSKELQLALLTPINKFLPYIGIAIYPIFIYLALI